LPSDHVAAGQGRAVAELGEQVAAHQGLGRESGLKPGAAVAVMVQAKESAREVAR
jgi:hypothetical protein